MSSKVMSHQELMPVPATFELPSDSEFDPSLEGLDEMMDLLDPKVESIDEPEEIPEVTQEDAYMLQVKTFEAKRLLEITAFLESRGVTKENIEQLKARHKSVYTFSPSDTDVYLWRPCMKKEWDAIQLRLGTKDNGEEKVAKAVVNRCVLFPMMNDALLDQTRAGFLTTMFNVILLGSYFFSPETSMQHVIEL